MADITLKQIRDRREAAKNETPVDERSLIPASVTFLFTQAQQEVVDLVKAYGGELYLESVGPGRFELGGYFANEEDAAKFRVTPK